MLYRIGLPYIEELLVLYRIGLSYIEGAAIALNRIGLSYIEELLVLYGIGLSYTIIIIIIIVIWDFLMPFKRIFNQGGHHVNMIAESNHCPRIEL